MKKLTILDDFYNELCELVEKGDKVLIKQGKNLINTYCKNSEFVSLLVSKPANKKYTRNVLKGSRGKPVIVVMEWPAGYCILPHEHHGRPCFEYVLKGEIVSTEFTKQKVGNFWKLNKLKTEIVSKGNLAILNPEKTDIHRIYSPIKSITLNIYPNTETITTGFVLNNKTELYSEKDFKLTKD